MRKTDKTPPEAAEEFSAAGKVIRLRDNAPPQFDPRKLKQNKRASGQEIETRFGLKEIMNRAFTGAISFRAEEMAAPVQFTSRKDFEVDDAIARQFKALQQLVLRMNKAKLVEDIHIHLPDAAENQYDVTLHFEIDDFEVVVPLEFEVKALDKNHEAQVYVTLPYKQFDGQYFDLATSGFSQVVGDNILCTSNEFAECVMAIVGNDYFDARYAQKLEQKLAGLDNTP